MAPAATVVTSAQVRSFDHAKSVLTKNEVLHDVKQGKNGSQDLQTRLANSIRILAIDAVERARSGHPGMPMGMAPAATVLWDKHLRFNPLNPSFINRDRFVLSAGHGSILLYSLMYLFGYPSMTLDDLKNFRKKGSVTPGHPENVATKGVEVTTGPLGQGISNAVGLALAESHLAARYNKKADRRAPGFSLIDHFTYCIAGDGCLMEGVAAEACSLAGHWRLGKLIVLYDDNSTTIEGSTELAFTEDVPQRYRSYGWQVIEVHNGNTDFGALNNAINLAKADLTRPSLICVKTTIGFGSPALAGTSAIHGSCLGEKEIAATRRALQYKSEPFAVQEDVLMHARRKVDEGRQLERDWTSNFKLYQKYYPELAAQFNSLVVHNDLPKGWAETLYTGLYKGGISAHATRKLSQEALNSLASSLPLLLGGSADLGPSNCSRMVGESDYSVSDRCGRNLHFGVREHGMGSICNGIALYNGGLIPYCATFLVFSDYCRAAIRTAALSRAGTIFIMTHDSVFVGEDGPTHCPVEHLASFRAMPGVHTFRPADKVEVNAAFQTAVSRRNGPSLIALSRQTFSCKPGKMDGALRGGYVFSQNVDMGETALPDAIIIATGSELQLAESAADAARFKGYCVRVVSIPCMELFEKQGLAYRESILPTEVGRNRRLVVEAGSAQCWFKYADHIMGVDDFAASESASDAAERFGLTEESVSSRLDLILAQKID